jgi:zinc protease
MKTSLIIPSVLFAACWPAATPCPAATTEFRLDSGLHVTLRPVFGASDVAVVVLFDVGELHDPPGKSGLGHLVEHIYVTAATPTTLQRTTREFMQAYPKGWNAQAGGDYTVIATVVSADRLGKELDETAERMGKLRIEQSDVDREVPRVLNEVANMFERVAMLAARNRARERLHPRPHGGRHGGLPEQVKKLTLDDVRRHWNDHYKAAGARLVVAGKIDSDSVEQQVRQTFADVPSGRAVPAKPAALPAEYGQARIRTADSSSGTLVCLGYRSPPPDSELFPAFLVLVARLQAGAMGLGTDPGQFPVIFAPLDDFGTLYVWSKVKEAETAEGTVERLSRFVAGAVPAKDVEQAIANAKRLHAFLLGTVKLPDLFLRNNVYGVGFGLARRSHLGIDGGQLAKEMDALERETIQECARQYLSEDRRAVVVVEAAGASTGKTIE